MSVPVNYKGKVREFDGPITKTGTSTENWQGTSLAGFLCPNIYASKTNVWFLQEDALDALILAQAELIDAGCSVLLVDAYRTYEEQAEAKKNKPHLVAPPWKSEHPKGTAIDARMFDEDLIPIEGDDGAIFDEANKSTWGDQDYLAEVLEKYGFVRTALPAEDWHFSFRG